VPFRDDLIERTIEQLGQMLTRLLVQQVDPAELEAFVQQTYQKHTGINGQLLRQLSSTDILQTLNTTGHLDKEKSYLLAALLEAESAIAERQNQEGFDLKLKALDLYLEAAMANVGIEDVQARIHKLVKELEAFVLPEASEWRLFYYEVKQKQFAQAENRLFDLQERLGVDAVKLKALRFYELLQQVSDDDLEKGGLSREEAEEGASDFESS
jgi:Family of unknown function (DUF6483)